MYKEIIISIFVIATVFSFDFVTQNYTKNTIGQLSNELYNLEQDIREEKMSDKDIEKNTNELYNKWMKHLETLAFFIEHDELEKVETNFTAGKSFIESKKYTDAMSEFEKTSFVLTHIKEKYLFSLENIF